MSNEVKINAVTICINYSDYLRISIENRRHFHRWLVLTVPSDRKTRELCAAHGVECVVSGVYGEDGALFSAKDNKSAGLNELFRLAEEPDAWLAVVDADILLPGDFPARLAGMRLDPECLYGVSNRLIVESEAQLAYHRRHPDTMHALGEAQRGIIGFFNLFHPRSGIRSYRPSKAGYHDDRRFQEQFPAGRRRFLPMGSLHLGPVAFNWEGRRSREFEGEETVAATPASASGGGAPADLQDLLPPGPVVSIGPVPASLASRTPLRFDLGEGGPWCLESPPDGARIICVTVPLDAEQWRALRTAVLRAGRPVTLCGTLFSPADWPDQMAAISLVLGRVERRTEEGFWTLDLAPDAEVSPAASRPAVVIIFPAESSLDSLGLLLRRLGEENEEVVIWTDKKQHAAAAVLAAVFGRRIILETACSAFSISERMNWPHSWWLIDVLLDTAHLGAAEFILCQDAPERLVEIPEAGEGGRATLAYAENFTAFATRDVEACAFALRGAANRLAWRKPAPHWSGILEGCPEDLTPRPGAAAAPLDLRSSTVDWTWRNDDLVCTGEAWDSPHWTLLERGEVTRAAPLADLLAHLRERDGTSRVVCAPHSVLGPSLSGIFNDSRWNGRRSSLLRAVCGEGRPRMIAGESGALHAWAASPPEFPEEEFITYPLSYFNLQWVADN